MEFIEQSMVLGTAFENGRGIGATIYFSSEKAVLEGVKHLSLDFIILRTLLSNVSKHEKCPLLWNTLASPVKSYLGGRNRVFGMPRLSVSSTWGKKFHT